MRRLSFLILAGAISLNAHAALLLEPYAGYSLGNVSRTPLNGTNSSDTTNGFAYGGRGGFVFRHFVILAYEYQGISAQEKSSGNPDVTWTQGTQFATLGFQAPYGLRLLGSYGFDARANEQLSTNPVKYSGSAYKITLGWRLRNDVAINADYTIYNFKHYLQNGTTSVVSDTYSKFNTSSLMFNISIPLTFFNMSGGGR